MSFPSCQRNRAGGEKSGFTLIEVLVATTILLVIVILVSMVFQGSNAAFQSGSRKIASQTLSRNIIGMISHDLSMAVDPLEYPGLENLVDFGPANSSSFFKGPLTFAALTGKPGGASSSERALQVISYEFRGNVLWRTVENLDSDGVSWSKSGDSSRTCLNAEADGLDGAGCGFRSLYYSSNGGNRTGVSSAELPDNVEIKVSVDPSRKVSFVSARSAGKDRQFGTDDDIIVGGNPTGE